MNRGTRAARRRSIVAILAAVLVAVMLYRGWHVESFAAPRPPISDLGFRPEIHPGSASPALPEPRLVRFFAPRLPRFGWAGRSSTVTPLRKPESVDADSSLIEILINVSIEEGPSQIMLAFAEDSLVLIPAGQFFDLAEVQTGTVVVDSVFTGVLYPGGIPFEYLGDSLLRRGDESMPLDSGSTQWVNGELYVESSSLGWLLNVEVHMNWEDLELRVRRAGGLPVVSRMRRDRMRARLAAAAAADHPVTQLPAVRTLFDGAALDWSVSSATRDPVQTSSVQLTLGATAAGGDLNLFYERSSIGVADSSVASFRTRGSWIKAWPEQRAVRQVRLGDVGATGRRFRPIRGAAITNEPFLRPVAFGQDVLIADFPAGWEVEVYRHGRLVGFGVVEDDGRFSLSLPVQYGANPLELVGYGPNGEVLRIERTFEIPFQRLPAGTFEYGVSGGECTNAGCDAMGNVDLRYGINHRLTAQIGTDTFWRDTLSNRVYPYVLASFAATPALSLTMEGVLNASLEARGDFVPSTGLNVRASHTWFDNSDSIPILGIGAAPSFNREHQRTELSALWRPRHFNDRVYLLGSAVRTQREAYTEFSTRAAMSLQFGNARFTTGISYLNGITGLREEAIGGDVDIIAALMRETGILKSAIVRAGTAFDSDLGLRSVNAAVGRTLSGPLRIDLETAWDRMTDRVRFGAVLTTLLPGMRAISRNQYDNAGGLRGTQYLEGSVLWNRRDGRAEVEDGRAVGRAAVTGEVFVDENGNDRWDDGEILVPGINLRVGPASATTDSMGSFSIRDLVAFQNTTVEIDTLSIPNPLWIPKYPRGGIQTQPNSYQFVSVPLIQAGEVTGRVVFDDTGAPGSGIRVSMNNEAGTDSLTVVAFSDGTFYALGVRPGVWVATVPETILQRLGGRVTPIRFEVGSDPASSIVEALEIRIERN